MHCCTGDGNEFLYLFAGGALKKFKLDICLIQVCGQVLEWRSTAVFVLKNHVDSASARNPVDAAKGVTRNLGSFAYIAVHKLCLLDLLISPSLELDQYLGT
jgi:hypothetical protein